MKFKKWSDRVGETKVVDGLVFTLFESLPNDKVSVEVNGELYTVSRGVWRNGKFSKLLRILKPKYVGEVKVINDILFQVLEYAKGKVKVMADGTDTVEEMGSDTWKNERFFRNGGKFFKDLAEKVFKTVRKVTKRVTKKAKKVVKYEVALIPTKPITAEILERDINNLENTLHYKEFRQTFRKLAGTYHPDKGGNATAFRMIKDIYEFQADILKTSEEALSGLNLKEEDYINITLASLKAKKAVAKAADFFGGRR